MAGVPSSVSIRFRLDNKSFQAFELGHFRTVRYVLTVSHIMRPYGPIFASLIVVCVACAPGEKIVVDMDDEEPPATADEAEPESDELTCPHVGEPAADVTAFPLCPSCEAGGARCVPKALLPPDKLSSFGECDADNACVPELIMETRGQFIPQTCRSVLGSEGRCLSRCLPSVAPQAGGLPQDNCAAVDVCVPCFDPITAEPTGACEQSCDPGPAEAPIELAGCCHGDGVCLPSAAVGDKADDLAQDICPQNDGPALCVPKPFLEDGYKPMTCTDGSILGDAPGVCLPDCLPAVQGLLQDLLLDQEGCQTGYKCAPCDHPITGNPTGACEL